MPVADDVVTYLGSHATVDYPTVDAAVTSVTALVAGYTRSVGFEVPGLVPDDLAAVIVSVAARTVLNPEAKRVFSWATAGDYQESHTYSQPAGFTLLESAVLHRYRRRVA